MDCALAFELLSYAVHRNDQCHHALLRWFYFPSSVSNIMNPKPVNTANLPPLIQASFTILPPGVTRNRRLCVMTVRVSQSPSNKAEESAAAAISTRECGDVTFGIVRSNRPEPAPRMVRFPALVVWKITSVWL